MKIGNSHYLNPSLLEKKVTAPSKQSDEEVLQKLAETKPETVNNAAALKSLGNNHFRGKLEQHIRHHNRGEGYRSSSLYAELGRRSMQNASALAKTDPAALSLYTGLSTSMSYGKNARMVTAVSETIQAMQKIQQTIAENS